MYRLGNCVPCPFISTFFMYVFLKNILSAVIKYFYLMLIICINLHASSIFIKYLIVISLHPFSSYMDSSN